ncbi:pantetheine-phosphate adenylyltransferase [Nitrososphaera viennensis]|uniref:Phosphopantetheine adenylyltransferase n=1 Tax=Nitrososphaera viennensis TaxID=1034015 RepID=A0A977IEC3_9ARCH|nr:pantetheine-phosphate adenylyltransferase [Nitrososphaera viennensis]UVS69217.1 pantetheine-phosphate adenylyltransferase [Nitrososphaera viennensis]
MALKRFRVVATGGTFDEIHAGHIALLSKAFEVGEKVIIGVTSDEFVKGRKKINHDFSRRVSSLKEMIRKEFGDNVSYEIAKLDSEFGPAVTTGDVGALVASAETQEKGTRLNEIRKKNGLAPAQVIAVPLIKAEDGKPISSTRIRAGEIDRNGRLLKA